MSDPYTEGPLDQKWEVEENKEGECFVARHGCNARDVHTERMYWVSDPNDARHLVNELNELDRLRRIEHALLALTQPSRLGNDTRLCLTRTSASVRLDWDTISVDRESVMTALTDLAALRGAILP